MAIKKIGRAKALAIEYNKLQTDDKRLDFIIDHKDDMMLQLDNDQTFPIFICEDMVVGEELEDVNAGMNCFDQYFGANEGIVMILARLGIRAEEV
jgi:hypothetical protein